MIFCLKFYELEYGSIDLIDLLDDSRTKYCLLGIDYDDWTVENFPSLAIIL